MLLTNSNCQKSDFLRIATLTCLLSFIIFASPVLALDVLETFDVPDNTSGLAWDGRLFWMGGIGDNGGIIQAYDPERREIVDTIYAPADDCYGLTWFNDRLVYLSPNSDSTYFLNGNGHTTAVENPFPNMVGLGSDGESLWSSSYHNPSRILVQMNAEGEVLRSMPYSGRHCRDMAVHNEMLYAADRITREIRIINPLSGRLSNAFDTPGTNPAGVASDGEYVWVLDDGNKEGFSQLFKIAFREVGGIRLSAINHNFGSVVIDSSSTWTVWVYNDGDREAEFIELEVDPIEMEDTFRPHVWDPFRQIDAGDSAQFRITFIPGYADSMQVNFGLIYDLDYELNWINVRGKGVTSRRQITIVDRNLDFGTGRTGQYIQTSNLRFINLENSGGQPLTVSEIQSSNQAFSIGWYEFPHTFETPGLYRIPVFFRADQAWDSEGIFTVVSNDENNREIRISTHGRAEGIDYSGGTIIWDAELGNRNDASPTIRGFVDIEDVTADGLIDIVIATNTFTVAAFHGAANFTGTAVWSYNTNLNPWRSGMVYGSDGISGGDDWDGDGVEDIVFGLDGSAMNVIALSGRTGEEIWIFDTHTHRWGGGEVIFTDGKYDLNGDGINDVFGASSGPNNQHATNAVFLLDGRDGVPIWLTELEVPPRFVRTVDDFTGDGYRDLFILDVEGSVFGMDGRRGHIVWDNEVEGDIRSFFKLDDANGDHSVDLVVVTNMHGITLINGSNGVRIWHLPAGEPDYNVRNLTIGIGMSDLNGNGSPEILVADAARLIWAIDSDTREEVWYDPVPLTTNALSMAPAADFDEDDLQDFLVGTEGGRLRCISGNGRVGLWSLGLQNEGDGIQMALAVPDVDGNGQMDVLAATTNGLVMCLAGTWVGQIVSVNEEFRDLTPGEFSLGRAYPNPFNGAVSVPVKLEAPSDLTFSIYDSGGRLIHSEQTGRLKAGVHKFTWDAAGAGKTIPSGAYFMQVKNGDQSLHTKIFHLK